MTALTIISGQQKLSSTPAQTSIGVAAAVVLVANHKRKGLIVQNTGTTTIKINLGSTLPSQTVYQIALKGCTVADDGSGGAYIDDLWTGDVAAISSLAGGTFVMTEVVDGLL